MVKLNRIYTRTGDDGTTGLVDGSRVAKHDARMDAIGDIDELNSILGFALVALADTAYADTLRALQNDLFDLGADVATPGEDFEPTEMQLRIVEAQVTHLETRIDTLNADLAPLTSFILPGGSEAAARVHLARAAARRAERALTRAADAVPINPLALTYINRFSDFLFVLCRHINKDGDGDPLWVPGASR